MSTDITPEVVLEQLWDMAQAVCQAIESLRPDLVLALYHSAQGMARAATTLWGETRDEPFPPLVGANLGQEKLPPYARLRQDQGMSCYVPFWDGPADAGHFLAWIARQTAWQEDLRGRVRAALSRDEPPTRVLVIDDYWHEGHAWRLAAGLLLATFPGVEIRTVIGYSEQWRGILSQDWLEIFYPEVLGGLARAVEADRARGHRSDAMSYLRALAPGTEDIDPASLGWQPIGVGSETLCYLGEFLPAEAWLSMPSWIYERIEEYTRERARGERGGLPEDQPHHRRLWGAFHPRLGCGELALRHVWLHGQIARREVVALCEVSPARATRLLGELVTYGDLVRRGRGRGTVYVLSPDAQGSTEV